MLNYKLLGEIFYFLYRLTTIALVFLIGMIAAAHKLGVVLEEVIPTWFELVGYIGAAYVVLESLHYVISLFDREQPQNSHDHAEINRTNS